jgi:hypothetical protein
MVVYDASIGAWYDPVVRRAHLKSLRRYYGKAQWREEEHPRGKPLNAGQFTQAAVHPDVAKADTSDLREKYGGSGGGTTCPCAHCRQGEECPCTSEPQECSCCRLAIQRYENARSLREELAKLSDEGSFEKLRPAWEKAQAAEEDQRQALEIACRCGHRPAALQEGEG